MPAVLPEKHEAPVANGYQPIYISHPPNPNSNSNTNQIPILNSNSNSGSKALPPLSYPRALPSASVSSDASVEGITPWPIPTLHLRCTDLSEEGCKCFFSCGLQPPSLLHDAVVNVLKWLYTPESCPDNVRSITLILRPMSGVAYTTSSELDVDHKEIHFSCYHIASYASSPPRARDEIEGVVVHEMVHCFQYNGEGTCPGGLIEGIADWVRLRAGYTPPHWKRGGKKWDEGYQNTAYFLDWVELNYSSHSSTTTSAPPTKLPTTPTPTFVPRLNNTLKIREYDEKIWKELTGKSVDELWREYEVDVLGRV